MALLTSLAKRGLVHCDFNEFNILVCLLCLPALLTRPSLHYCVLHEEASILFTGSFVMAPVSSSLSQSKVPLERHLHGSEVSKDVCVCAWTGG